MEENSKIVQRLERTMQISTSKSEPLAVSSHVEEHGVNGHPAQCSISLLLYLAPLVCFVFSCHCSIAQNIKIQGRNHYEATRFLVIMMFSYLPGLHELIHIQKHML